MKRIFCAGLAVLFLLLLLGCGRKNAVDDPETDAKNDPRGITSDLAGQLAKISIPNKDEAFLRVSMLKMYANPAVNQMEARGEK